MSKKDTPQQPTPPDPVALAGAQGAANNDTAITQARLNAVDQVSPFGSVKYTENPNTPSYDEYGQLVAGSGDGTPKFTQTVSLSPEQQKLYDTQQGVMQGAYNTAGQAIGNVQDTLSKPFTLDNLPGLATGVNSPAPQSGYDTAGPLFGIKDAGQIATSLAPSGNIQSGINTAGIQQTPLSAYDFAQQGQQTTDALMQRFNQDIGRQQDNVESRLNAQGIQRGSAGFANAQDDLNRARNDARASAYLAGNQEQNTLFSQQLSANQNLFGQRQAAGNFANTAQQQQYGQNLGAGQFFNQGQAQQFGQNTAQQQAYNQAAGQQTANNQGQAAFYNTAQGQGFAQALQNASMQNQARQQSIGEQQLQRSQPINEIATLLGLGGGIQTPNGAPNFGVNVGQTDVLGAYGLNQQAQQNNYNQQMQANNALWGGLSNLGGSLGGAWILSDRRAKNVLRKVGATATGIPLYLYSYKHDPGRQIVGPMAQDMRDPLAVVEINGALHIDMMRVA